MADATLNWRRGCGDGPTAKTHYVDWMDFFVITGLEWLCDGVAHRFGPAAAWMVTITSALTVVAAVVAVVVAVV